MSLNKNPTETHLLGFLTMLDTRVLGAAVRALGLLRKHFLASGCKGLVKLFFFPHNRRIMNNYLQACAQKYVISNCVEKFVKCR